MNKSRSPQYYVSFPLDADPKSLWVREPGFFDSLDEAIVYVKITCLGMATIKGVDSFHGTVCDRDTDEVVYAQ